jgi:hypothetical protein
MLYSYKWSDNWQVETKVPEENFVRVQIFLPQITQGLRCFCIFYNSINFYYFQLYFCLNFYFFFVFSLILSCLAERNFTPYDFAEPGTEQVPL